MTTDQKDTSSVFLDGVLLDVRLSFWRGKKVLSPEDLGLRTDQVPEIFRLGTKRVVPKDALDGFERIEGRLQYLTDRWAFPFPTGRAHFVPWAVVPEVLAEIKGLKQRYDDETSRFMDNYAKYREDLVAKYPQYKEAIERGGMDKATIRKKFQFAWTFYEVKLPKDLHLKAVSEKEAKDKAEAQRKAMTEAEAEFQTQYREQIDTFLSESVGKLRVMILNAVSTLADQVKDGKANAGTVRAVREAIDRFRALNFVGDAAVEEQLKALAAVLPSGETDMATVKAKLEAVVTATVEEAVKDNIKDIAENYRRKINIE